MIGHNEKVRRCFMRVTDCDIHNFLHTLDLIMDHSQIVKKTFAENLFFLSFRRKYSIRELNFLSNQTHACPKRSISRSALKSESKGMKAFHKPFASSDIHKIQKGAPTNQHQGF